MTEAFKAFHAAFCSVFSNIEIAVVDEIQVGARLAIRCDARVTLGSRPVSFAGMGFIELSADHSQIKVAYNYWNFLGLLEQMGIMPMNSFESALAGRLAPHHDVEDDAGRDDVTQ